MPCIFQKSRYHTILHCAVFCDQARLGYSSQETTIGAQQNHEAKKGVAFVGATEKITPTERRNLEDFLPFLEILEPK